MVSNKELFNKIKSKFNKFAEILSLEDLENINKLLNIQRNSLSNININMDCRDMNINELRDFAVKNKLTVVGTGKEGRAVKKDIFLACEAHLKKQRDIDGAKIADIMNTVYNTSDGLIEVYKTEKRMTIQTLLRLLNSTMEVSYEESDISEDNIRYILSEYKKLKNKSIKYGVNINPFEKTAEKFKETYSYRISDNDDNAIL